MKNAVRIKHTKKIGKLLVSIFSIVIIGYFLAPLFQVPSVYIILPLITTLASGLLSNRINRLINSFSILAPSMLLDEDVKTLQEAELRVVALKEHDRKNKTDTFKAVINELETDLAICQHFTEQSAPTLTQIYMRDIKVLMRIPSLSLSSVISSKYSQNKIVTIRDQMLNEARYLLSPYDAKSKVKLANFISEILDHLLPLKNYRPQYRVKPIFLIGPSGVGKTFLVQELTRIFWVPLCKVEMGKFDLEEFEGRQLPGSSGVPIAQPGTILATQTNNRLNKNECNDLVLMLDELDKSFQKGKDGASDITIKTIGILHPLLQVDTLMMTDKGYNIPINLKNTVVICTGNRLCFEDEFLEETTRKSLLDRITVIKMPPLTIKGKLEIVYKHAKRIVYSDNETDLTQKMILLALMNNNAKRIVETDKNPGLRSALSEVERSYSDSLTLNLNDKNGFKSLSNQVLCFLRSNPATRIPALVNMTSAQSIDSVIIDIHEPTSPRQ